MVCGVGFRDRNEQKLRSTSSNINISILNVGWFLKN
jgi:hypothetical protein